MFNVGDKIMNNDLVGNVIQYEPDAYYHTGIVFEDCPDELIWHNNDMLSKFILVGKINPLPGDEVKSKYNGKLRVLKQRLPDHDDKDMGECWEFKEDGSNSIDWISHYEFVGRRVLNEERYYCANCALPIERKEYIVCSGGCAQELEERLEFD